MLLGSMCSEGSGTNELSIILRVWDRAPKCGEKDAHDTVKRK